MGIKKFISKNKLGLVLTEKKFSELTTIKVGGCISKLYYPISIDNLMTVVEYLHKKRKKYFVIGNGSNIVASDKKFRPLVISGKLLMKSIEFKEDEFVVGAFMDLRIVIAKLVEKQISTLTNLAGIPATIGGAIVMNAGAYKSNISDNLLWVKYLDKGKQYKKNINELAFGYRTSQFKKDNIIILEADFKIINDNETIFNYKKILENRREKHPLNYPNCGSIFRNLENIKAYEVIKKINLVNNPIGGAKFSPLHANFIINFNNATSNDIYRLILLAKKLAKESENIKLNEEVILLNFSDKKYHLKHLKKLK